MCRISAMKVSAILLLIAAAHAAGDATSNRTNPRSFAVSRRIEVVTYEPIDYSYEGNLQDPLSKRRNCNNSSVYNQTQCNRTTLHVSDRTKAFLTGSLVTRFVPSLYGLVFLVSAPLNAVAFVAFTCRIHQKKPVAVYMSQLALTDLLFGLVLPLKVHYYASGPTWVFGEAACRAVTAAFYAYMNCSVLLMMCMSIDRMLAVVYPITSMHWRKPRNAALVCGGVWILALVAAVPLLTIEQTRQITEVGTTCHDALNPKDLDYLKIFISISCLFVFLPLVVTLTCYGAVLHTLMPKRAFKGAVSSSSLSKKQRKRATVMVLAVSLEFVMCFVPTNVILLLHCWLLSADEKTAEADELYVVYMLAVCLGSSSACLDPLLYYFGSSQCRRQISAVVCWKKEKRTTAASRSCSSQYCRPSTTHTHLRELEGQDQQF